MTYNKSLLPWTSYSNDINWKKICLCGKIYNRHYPLSMKNIYITAVGKLAVFALQSCLKVPIQKHKQKLYIYARYYCANKWIVKSPSFFLIFQYTVCESWHWYFFFDVWPPYYNTFHWCVVCLFVCLFLAFLPSAIADSRYPCALFYVKKVYMNKVLDLIFWDT